MQVLTYFVPQPTSRRARRLVPYSTVQLSPMSYHTSPFWPSVHNTCPGLVFSGNTAPSNFQTAVGVPPLLSNVLCTVASGQISEFWTRSANSEPGRRHPLHGNDHWNVAFHGARALPPSEHALNSACAAKTELYALNKLTDQPRKEGLNLQVGDDQVVSNFCPQAHLGLCGTSCPSPKDKRSDKERISAERNGAETRESRDLVCVKHSTKRNSR